VEISAPRDWFDLLDALGEEKGVAIILGASDTGKSTPAKFLITHLCSQRIKTVLVDTNMGQSLYYPFQLWSCP
jgi:polynucleotide 5'-kinase involved in rRNA processing